MTPIYDLSRYGPGDATKTFPTIPGELPYEDDRFNLGLVDVDVGRRVWVCPRPGDFFVRPFLGFFNGTYPDDFPNGDIDIIRVAASDDLVHLRDPQLVPTLPDDPRDSGPQFFPAGVVAGMTVNAGMVLSGPAEFWPKLVIFNYYFGSWNLAEVTADRQLTGNSSTLSASRGRKPKSIQQLLQFPGAAQGGPPNIERQYLPTPGVWFATRHLFNS